MPIVEVNRIEPMGREEIERIQARHLLWLTSDRKQGERADFSYKNLSGADLHGMRWDKAIFRCANLCNTNFAHAHLTKANFCSAKLSNAVFRKAFLYDAKFQYALLSNVDFTGANLVFADVRHAKMNGCKFAFADSLGWKTDENNVKEL